MLAQQLRPSDVPPDGRASTCRVRLRLAGRFRAAHVDDGAVRLTPHGERLLAFLAIRGPSPRPYVAFRLSPDQPEERSLGSLRSALWRLPRPGGDALVHSSPTTVRLADHVEVDVRRRYAEVAAWAERTPPPPGLVVERLTADVLPGWYDDWAIIERERFRQMRLHALERLCRWHTGAGRFPEAVMAGLAAVEGGPLRESARRCLVETHLTEGNVHEALRQVSSYLTALEDAGLPARLSRAMTDLLAAHQLPSVAPRPDR